MKTMSQCVTDFLASDGVRSLAKSTLKRQRIVLNYLTKPYEVEPGKFRPAVFDLHLPISRLDAGHIDATLNVVRGNVGAATMNAYRVDLRRFATWLHTRGFTKTNVGAQLKIHTVKTPAWKKKPITADQAAQLVAAAYEVHPRDGMTALLMLATGMRESEVIGLRWRDVDLIRQESVKAFRSKINDWHEAFLNDDVMEKVREWRIVYEQRHGPVKPTWYVVPALTHKDQRPGFYKMNPAWPMVPTNKQNSVGLRVKGWLTAVGETDLEGRASHTLRRTAGNLLKSLPGVTMNDVQHFYGHRSSGQSEEYLDVNEARRQLKQHIMNYHVLPPAGIAQKSEPI